MKLSEMKQLLVAGQIQLTKSLGQNFLHDLNQLRRIVETAGVTPTDCVLEIGPGLGPLTEVLLARAKHVLAIEKDQRLVALLRKRFREAQNFTLIHADAVDYLQQKPQDWREWKLVANLPYSAATSILTTLVTTEHGPRLMVVTVQWEVAQRLTAAAGAMDYGVLTLLVQLRYEPQGWFKIPRPCFFPEPEVDSAVITLRRRTQPLLSPAEAITFERIVRLSFSQRRKMMMKLLKTEWPTEQLVHEFQTVELSEQARAEQVSLQQFVALAKRLA